MSSAAQAPRRLRDKRLCFQVDKPTKELIERAALLQRRTLSDFCINALVDAARCAIAAHETLELSELDRAVFFDTLVKPPPSDERLARAFAEHGRRVAP